MSNWSRSSLRRVSFVVWDPTSGQIDNTVENSGDTVFKKDSFLLESACPFTAPLGALVAYGHAPYLRLYYVPVSPSISRIPTWKTWEAWTATPLMIKCHFTSLLNVKQDLSCNVLFSIDFLIATRPNCDYSIWWCHHYRWSPQTVVNHHLDADYSNSLYNATHCLQEPVFSRGMTTSLPASPIMAASRDCQRYHHGLNEEGWHSQCFLGDTPGRSFIGLMTLSGRANKAIDNIFRSFLE